MLIFIIDLKLVWSEEVLKIASLLINMSSRSLANNIWAFWKLVHWCHFSPTPWCSSRASPPIPPCFTCGPCYYILSCYYIVWPNPKVPSCVTIVSPMNSSGKKTFLNQNIVWTHLSFKLKTREKPQLLIISPLRLNVEVSSHLSVWLAYSCKGQIQRR